MDVFDNHDHFKNDKMNSDIIVKLKEAISASSPSKGQDPNHVYLAAYNSATQNLSALDSKLSKKQEMMRRQFKELVSESLKLFIDTFIEVPSR